MTGDSRESSSPGGESEEEEAVRRWAERDFLDLERQIAKQWRRLIERIRPKRHVRERLVKHRALAKADLT